MKHFFRNLIYAKLFILIGIHTQAAIHPVVRFTGKRLWIQIQDSDRVILSSLKNDACLLVTQPVGTTEVKYNKSIKTDGTLSLYGGGADGLEISESYRMVTPDLIERSVAVKAKSDQRYYLDFGWKTMLPGDYYSFTGEEKTSVKYAPGCSGPEFGQSKTLETFPFLGVRNDNKLYGLIGDTPGVWENLSVISFDKENRNLSLCNGDGAALRTIIFPAELEAPNAYRAHLDGWQHIEMGETQTWKTWIFSSDVSSFYDIQLAAHCALANAKGFSHSGIEAILRNTSYLLLRRNLLRHESDYIFISGVGYGWKQWVSDGFYMSQGLDDVLYDRAAYSGVFYERMSYEDNAHYYLIWSVLVKRAGGNPNMNLAKRAYNFIRDHEKDGLYIPPAVLPGWKINKTYHDQLPYEDDDSPSSDQGFHCGALMAAKELGLPVTDEDIEKAIAGYCRMFNQEGGYMGTSLKQQQYIGQDALYGEVLTYVVFGKKLLPNEMVKKHLETTMKIQSAYGMRVISKTNGDLLDGHNGVYQNGGSWFLNDAANYLDGLIHGMDAEWIDNWLIWRIEKELAFMPAFHESISTLTGKPHGHHLYSWNSGYWWLRREVRRRLGLTGPDQVEERIDKELGVIYHNGYLVLNPRLASLRPKEDPESR